MILKALLFLSSRPSAYTLGILGFIVGIFVNGYCKGFVLSTAALTLYQQLPKGKQWLKRAAIPVGLILVFVLTSLPARAQFAVIDAATVTQMGKIWQQDISTYAKLVQEVQVLTQMYQTAQQNYTLASTMAQAIKSKNPYAIQGAITMGQSFVVDHFGESAGWNKAIDSGLSIPMVYGHTTLPMALHTSFLAAEKIGSSSHLTSLARVGIIDDLSQKTMSVSAQIHQQQSSNQPALSQWESSVYSTNPALNTTAAQQNLTNIGQVQLYEQGRAALSVNSILAQQLMVQNMRDRDHAMQDLNRWQEVLDYQATQPHALGGMEQTIHNHQPY